MKASTAMKNMPHAALTDSTDKRAQLGIAHKIVVHASFSGANQNCMRSEATALQTVPQHCLGSTQELMGQVTRLVLHIFTRERGSPLFHLHGARTALMPAYLFLYCQQRCRLLG
ncbi:hypothetical protein COCSUDRAFT_34583 [Coccomyxa subellipsoidea C-169]|uniref:Uncharacterized protein n=1 Tax=Coccomyxa subellipsoidea (strain C-169) TaxID=574566 RepID=I0YIN8_COCSC|nr:hypothetical protein COCSUDRAFT_34583 [Coccomyxa subellipsoidea C-169]EIE18257.1 hypothetical protein COCSUDRAFT_34583 [Coccomyxa subellipsoidea C-169]|eukprot:XP_005642801.1 hypothetical protein COCSUDRAFT_34583 [Coccomyxa subellipsoidea C-169]